MNDLTSKRQDAHAEPATPDPTNRSRRPWIGLAGLSCALFALLCWVGGYYAVQALAAEGASPSALESEVAVVAAPDPAVEAADPKPEVAKAQREMAATEEVGLRERSANALRRFSGRLDGSASPEDTALPPRLPAPAPEADAANPGEEADVLELARRAGATARAIREQGGEFGVKVEAHGDGGFRLSFGKPGSTALGPPQPTWIRRVEAGCIVATLVFAGAAILLGCISSFSQEPKWLGMLAIVGGSIVITLYVLMAVLAMVATIVALLILAAILSAFVGGASI